MTSDGRVFLIELTGRMTGARIATEVVPLATGVDPLPNAVRLAMNRPLNLAELRPTRNIAAVQRYLPAQGGVVEWVGGIQGAAQSAGVYDLFWGMDLWVGRQLPEFHSNEDVIAGVIVAAKTVAEAERLADLALANVPILLRPGA